MNRFIKTIKSTYLCIRYPFLYPRNRFNDRHWTDWKIESYLYGDKYANGKWNKETHEMEYEPIIGLAQKSFKYVNAPTEDSRFNQEKVIISYTNFIWFNIVKFVYDRILPIFHCIPTYTEWDSVELSGKGWYKAFGKQYLKELGNAVNKLSRKDRKSFRIVQIKEKFGTLRVYTNFGSEEIYNIIDKYEKLSYHTCINCGKPATKVTDGYILPYCDDCYKDDYGEPFKTF